MSIIHECNWGEVEICIQQIIKDIEESGKIIKQITGLPRGGLIPAVYLSHRLDIPYIPIHQLIDSLIIPKNKILVVDDIVDSGETISRIIDEKYLTASLHYRIGASHVPNFYGSVLHDQRWILYPWEKKDSKPLQDYKNNNI